MVCATVIDLYIYVPLSLVTCMHDLSMYYETIVGVCANAFWTFNISAQS